MKEMVEVTKCDHCKELIKDPDKVITVQTKDFCSVDCLVKFVQNDHTVQCYHCRCGYSYTDAGYGDDDVICAHCKGLGIVSVPAKHIFCSDETINLLRPSF